MFNIHIEFERWKLNREYDVYVSTLGRVKDSNKKLLELNINSKTGYVFVKLNNKFMSLHSLVLETFVGKREENITIDHIDSNKRNNRLSNLEYVTQEENLSRANDKLIDPIKTISKLSKKVIIAENAVNWTLEYLKRNLTLKNVNIGELVERVDYYARNNQTYCGYKLSLCDNKIKGVLVA